MAVKERVHSCRDQYLFGEADQLVSSVGALIHTGALERGGGPSFLLVEQRDIEGRPFGIPAGRVESSDKDIEGALVREVREEVGIDLEVQKLERFIRVPRYDGQRNVKDTRVVFSYAVRLTDLGRKSYDASHGIWRLDGPSPSPDEIGEMVVVPSEKLFQKGERYVPSYRWDIMHWIKAGLENRSII